MLRKFSPISMLLFVPIKLLKHHNFLSLNRGSVDIKFNNHFSRSARLSLEALTFRHGVSIHNQLTPTLLIHQSSNNFIPFSPNKPRITNSIFHSSLAHRNFSTLATLIYCLCPDRRINQRNNLIGIILLFVFRNLYIVLIKRLINHQTHLPTPKRIQSCCIYVKLNFNLTALVLWNK